MMMAEKSNKIRSLVGIELKSILDRRLETITQTMQLISPFFVLLSFGQGYRSGRTVV
jgi:hypothetical protein